MNSHPNAYVCFPEAGLMRLVQRAAGPVRELETLFGPYGRVVIDPYRGVLVVAPGAEAMARRPSGFAAQSRRKRR